MNTLDFLKNGSGIHIKKKNRGKFTSYCGGKVTDECIQKGKNSSNPAIRKRATFALNSRRWSKHKNGGIVKALEGTILVPEYPVYWSNSSPEYKGMNTYFKKNPQITGAAVGGGMQGSDDEGSRIILKNPYSEIITDPNDPAWDGLISIERIRHAMGENNYKPNFELTPTLKAAQQIIFKGLRYGEDDEAFKQSIISRILVGDNAFGPSKELIKESTRFKFKGAPSFNLLMHYYNVKYKKGGILKAQKGTSFFKKAGDFFKSEQGLNLIGGLISNFKLTQSNNSNLNFIGDYLKTNNQEKFNTIKANIENEINSTIDDAYNKLKEDFNAGRTRENPSLLFYQHLGWMLKNLALNGLKDLLNNKNKFIDNLISAEKSNNITQRIVESLPDILNSFKSSKKQLASMDFKNLNTISKIAPTTDFGNGFNYNINSGLTYNPNISLTNFINKKW